MYIVELLLNVALFLLLVWLCMFLVVLVHELGHALMYRIFLRDKDWHISIGTGKPLVRFKKFTVRAFMVTGFFSCSLTNGTKFQSIMMLLGGPMANVAFILVLSILLRILSRRGLAVTQQNLVWFLPFTRWANVFQLIAAAIPLKFSIWPVKNYVSDGMRILLKAREPRKD